MSPSDVFQILEKMIEGLEPSPQEAEMIDHLLDTIKRWELILEFYAKRNYDNGLIARDALGCLTEADRKNWNAVKTSATNIPLKGDKLDA